MEVEICRTGEISSWNAREARQYIARMEPKVVLLVETAEEFRQRRTLDTEHTENARILLANS